jgi:hypothetical protein
MAQPRSFKQTFKTLESILRGIEKKNDRDNYVLVVLDGLEEYRIWSGNPYQMPSKSKTNWMKIFSASGARNSCFS